MADVDSTLKAKAHDQLDRLVAQLADLEDAKDDLDQEEYEELRGETLEQLEEFESSLERMNSGDVSLRDTTRAILSEAFKTPEIIKMFAARKSGGLRQKLIEIERDLKIGRLTQTDFESTKVEILGALLKIDPRELSADEKAFLSARANDALKSFVSLETEAGLDPDRVKALLK